MKVVLIMVWAELVASAASAQGCAQPRPWRDVYSHPGPPRAEVSVCLKHQAWEVRSLNVPLQSAAAGIVAQCEVQAVFFAGPEGSDARFHAQNELDAVDGEIVEEATADVVRYRTCIAR